MARIDDTILAATSNQSGSVSVLFMELPEAVPNATTADLKVRGSAGKAFSGSTSAAAFQRQHFSLSTSTAALKQLQVKL